MGKQPTAFERFDVTTPAAPIPQRFARIQTLLGEAACARLRESFVTVVGLGAVGSYATEALARSGIGRLRLVDFDRVQPTNFNRQLYALESNLGRLKVDVARERIAQIHPQCRVEALAVFAHNDTLDVILDGPPDLVIDAIDSLNPKVHLLAAVQRRGISIISSMGAALRTDPSAIRIGPLSQTDQCPLARLLRRRLRRMQVHLDFTCVYSIEPVARPARDTAGPNPDEDNMLHRGRKRRVLGSLPTLTGLFGLYTAHAALDHLLHNSRT